MADQYIGEIRMFSGSYAPIGWALCDGQLLSIAENELLFSLIGTTYGGDGMTTFCVPDMRGRVPIHQGKNPKTQRTFFLGAKDGVEQVMLTAQELPKHTHAANVSSQSGTQTSPANGVWAKNVTQFSTNAADGIMNPTSLAHAGENHPHENMMPFGVINFIIALEGQYPPQS